MSNNIFPFWPIFYVFLSFIPVFFRQQTFLIHPQEVLIEGQGQTSTVHEFGLRRLQTGKLRRTVYWLLDLLIKHYPNKGVLIIWIVSKPRKLNFTTAAKTSLGWKRTEPHWNPRQFADCWLSCGDLNWLDSCFHAVLENISFIQPDIMVGENRAVKNPTAILRLLQIYPRAIGKEASTGCTGTHSNWFFLRNEGKGYVTNIANESTSKQSNENGVRCSQHQSKRPRGLARMRGATTLKLLTISILVSLIRLMLASFLLRRGGLSITCGLLQVFPGPSSFSSREMLPWMLPWIKTFCATYESSVLNLIFDMSGLHNSMPMYNIIINQSN